MRRSASVPSLSWSNRRLGMKAAAPGSQWSVTAKIDVRHIPMRKAGVEARMMIGSGQARRQAGVAAATKVGAEHRADRERDKGRRGQEGECPGQRFRDGPLRTRVDDALDIQLEQVRHRKPVRGGVRDRHLDEEVEQHRHDDDQEEVADRQHQPARRLRCHVPARMRPAITSARARTVAWMLARTLSGMIEASTIRRLSIPCTRPLASTTAPGSSARPIRHVLET